MREYDPLISEYRHDKKRPRSSEALLILQRVASLVKPIMRRRQWKVGTLAEMYPGERYLLGLNYDAGRKICLRLRHSSDERQFLAFDDIVDTMLHELCHIVHGPHHQKFHALWNQLRDEHLELIMKGYTGEGFLSKGHRLGGSRIPVEEARRRARAAAEQRRALSAGSGQRVGGASVARGTDMRQVIADAAQRRRDILNGCASGADNSAELAEEASRNGFRTQAEEDDANERAIMEAVIDLIEQEEREKYGPSYIPPSQQNPAGPRSMPSPPLVPETNRPGASSHPQNSDDLILDDTSYDKPWSCPTCTLDNPAEFLCCDACASERPRPSTDISVSASIISEPPKTTAKSRSHKRTISQSISQGTSKSTTRAKESPATPMQPQKASKRRMGRTCQACGSFMEIEWVSCSNCSTSKQES
ncbi:metalloendopeptidase WSS1 [Aspergillus saccharolyticus JOP 1030-1]|uniref:Putative zinc metallopeptidase n=1 Tax=Aspergillus saccharolyticus JOP 1030-1 TaxID=1450539 RepID=A0A318ZS86_9EURO|nr:putative zinc metallopeptidase [Aspergillus saccharolyticus JOP 1030-1]PYH49977.1 putative zinc metallopeptidase [Aspergillus saccharolyticus JOP 1030-1]